MSHKFKFCVKMQSVASDTHEEEIELEEGYADEDLAQILQSTVSNAIDAWWEEVE